MFHVLINTCLICNVWLTGLNNVELIGYTGGDPTHSGTEDRPVTKFSLGTTNYYRTKDGKRVKQQ